MVDLGHQRRGVQRSALSGPRSENRIDPTTEPRHLQRPLPRPVPRLLGTEVAAGSGRGPPVLDRRLQRAAGLLIAGLAGAQAADLRFRHRPRQPEPRLRDVGDQPDPPGADHTAPPDHRRSPPRGDRGTELAQADQPPPVVFLRGDAGPCRPHGCRGSSSSARTRSTTSTGHGSGQRTNAPGSRRRRSRPVQADARGATPTDII